MEGDEVGRLLGVDEQLLKRVAAPAGSSVSSSAGHAMCTEQA